MCFVTFRSGNSVSIPRISEDTYSKPLTLVIDDDEAIRAY